MLNKETIFQSTIWEDFQASLPGRKAGHLGSGKNKLSWSVIPTIFKQTYLFLNHGPLAGSLTDYWPEVVALAKKNHCSYIKVEPVHHSDVVPSTLSKLQLVSSKHHIQPDTTLVLDLSLSLEDLLKQMKPKGRYNIKVATKHGITYQCFDGNSPEIETKLDQFYALLSSTATRDRFGIHSRQYFSLFLAKLFPHSRLYLAYHGEKVVAGLIATFYKDESIYYYGASSNHDRETMATYGLQWHVIQEAQAAGAKTYDFLGIAPDNASADHPWQGVTTFKKKFGGQIITYPGTYHFIISPFVYFLIHAPKKVISYTRAIFHR